ncbi:hypothetical protein HMPREF9554_01150 [Treponema phagedenis F0421]|nr:hypothetical protein HMPREF9554_01150 [Treponema phagedenis F0421]
MLIFSPVFKTQKPPHNPTPEAATYLIITRLNYTQKIAYCNVSLINNIIIMLY